MKKIAVLLGVDEALGEEIRSGLAGHAYLRDDDVDFRDVVIAKETIPQMGVDDLFKPIRTLHPRWIFARRDAPADLAWRMGLSFPWPQSDQRPHGPGSESGPCVWFVEMNENGEACIM